MNQFKADVLKGLRSTPKYLQSKYFYNKKGDELFQKIMESGDYYLTNCEMDILRNQSSEIVELVKQEKGSVDVVELGAGDASKSIHLLKAMRDGATLRKYYPVDISANIISLLENKLPREMPGILMEGLNGEYISMLCKTRQLSKNYKLVLFLGSNIGNIPAGKVTEFCRGIRDCLNQGDLLMIGFDLKKNPHVIRAAYNDRGGFTKQFNLNLLQRINEELGGNFNLENFEHYPTYDPGTGACKSYLFSTTDQVVKVCGDEISFAKDETIYMEISQKYSLSETNEIAVHSGFTPIAHFFDSKKWFADVIWRCS